MAKATKKLEATTKSVAIEKTMAAVLAVLIAERDERIVPPVSPRKSEVILADAGLTISEIALLTGKKYGAVQMAINRSRRPKRPSPTKRSRPTKRPSRGLSA